MNTNMKVIEFKELDEIEDRSQDIEKLNKDLIQIKEIMNILATIVKEDGESIENIRDKTEMTKESAKNALDEIKKASQLQKQTLCVIS